MRRIDRHLNLPMPIATIADRCADIEELKRMQIQAMSLADKADSFMRALTDLSRMYEIGITGEPVLFEMLADDSERSYSSDNESKMSFR